MLHTSLPKRQPVIPEPNTEFVAATQKAATWPQYRIVARDMLKGDFLPPQPALDSALLGHARYGYHFINWLDKNPLDGRLQFMVKAMGSNVAELPKHTSIVVHRANITNPEDYS